MISEPFLPWKVAYLDVRRRQRRGTELKGQRTKSFDRKARGHREVAKGTGSFNR